MPYTAPPVAALDDHTLVSKLQHLVDHKTKPIGSLGQIESLAVQLGLILQTLQPKLESPQMLIFAGDHGLARRGVSAYPQEVTWQMVRNFTSGGAAASVLARQHGLALTVIDAGVAHDFEPRPGLLIHKIAHGTADASREPAMSDAQCEAALRRGADVVKGLPGNVVLIGEMGIGNTSSAALLLSRLGGEPIASCVGRGTGLGDEALQRKVGVLREALARHPDAASPFAALAALGGFEIAMMTGAVLQAAAERRVIVVDGFISSSAVLVASAMVPHVLAYCVFAHQSDEAGHGLMLKHLRARPLLKLGLRLGEGSGAALAWPLIESACRILREMASFDAAGVTTSEHDEGRSHGDNSNGDPS